MKRNRCLVCGHRKLTPSGTKFDVAYWSCDSCGALFAFSFDAALVETHNQYPESRAEISAQESRLERVVHHLGRRLETVLDFGCGQGQYIEFLTGKGISAVGIDQDTSLKLKDLSPASFDVINMVEVIEHLFNPKAVLKKLMLALKQDGVLYIESSFVDHLDDPMQNEYVDPRIGHCCIHSRKSIEYLAKTLRAKTEWINNNVLVFKKEIAPPSNKIAFKIKQLLRASR